MDISNDFEKLESFSEKSETLRVRFMDDNRRGVCIQKMICSYYAIEKTKVIFHNCFAANNALLMRSWSLSSTLIIIIIKLFKQLLVCSHYHPAGYPV